MKYPLLISGAPAEELTSLFLSSKSWQRRGNILCRDDREIFQIVSKTEPALPLLPSAQKSAEMLRWFWDRDRLVRSARAEDVEDICRLKVKSIVESFTFFSEEELKRALLESASKKYISQELDHLWVARKEEKTVAVAGLKGTERAFLYSVYSQGHRAGAALTAWLLFLARKGGAESVFSNVYKNNDHGARGLRQFGFRPEPRLRASTYVPGVLITRWVLRWP